MKMIGLAFMNPTSLWLSCQRYFDVKEFPGDDWDKWLKQDHRRKRTAAVLSDERYFPDSLKCGAHVVIVLKDVDWLARRGILCLDGERDGHNVIMKNFTPHDLFQAVKRLENYAPSKTDVWKSKSNPADRCAGCKHMKTDCAHDPTPTSKRPCKTDFEAEDAAAKVFRLYNLSQLIHVCINAAKEDTLLIEPKDFWKMTYAFAMGGMSQSEWISKYGRVLKTAGCPKMYLQNVVLWVKRYGATLQAGKMRNPPSKLDLKLSRKLV
jgi:hypothetical protein